MAAGKAQAWQILKGGNTVGESKKSCKRGESGRKLSDQKWEDEPASHGRTLSLMSLCSTATEPNQKPPHTEVHQMSAVGMTVMVGGQRRDPWSYFFL